MNTKLASWATSLLTVVGVILVGAFFLAWINDGTSGLSIAWDQDHWLFLVPLSGAALVAAAGSESPYTRLAAIGAGLLVAGNLMLEMLGGVLHGGLDLWLMLGGAAIVLAGLGESARGLRIAGGAAVLLGFFAPWASDSMFHGVLATGLFFDINVKVLWLIPVAGITAIVSAQMQGTRGRNAAAFAGVAVFGSMLWMIGSLASFVFAWGAWATLGASATALALGVLAPIAQPAKRA